MIEFRFYLYSVFKNIRFADPFFILFLHDIHLDFTTIGILLGLQHLITVVFEIPAGALADYWGRCRATSLCFVSYFISFTGFAWVASSADLLTSDLLGVSFSRLGIVAVCMLFFSLGEALRTGSHKAIMLDYLELRGIADQATRLIGRTRMISKFSSGLSAIAGGTLLAFTSRYDPLFAGSAIAALGGFILMLTYPEELDGGALRNEELGRVTFSLRNVAKGGKTFLQSRDMRLMLIQSLLFESQFKVVLKYFSQPFFKGAMMSIGVPFLHASGGAGIVSSGAFWVGVHELLRDGVGGIGARFSESFESRCGSGKSALKTLYFASVVTLIVLAVSSFFPFVNLILGILAVLTLTLLQNTRRPIFISEFSKGMVKSQRAFFLSAESVLCAMVVAVIMPILGLVADSWGIAAVWIVSFCIACLGLVRSTYKIWVW